MINNSCFIDFPILESKRLIFRQLNLDDVSAIQYIRSNKKVVAAMDSDFHKNVIDSQKFITKNINSYANKKGIFWAIIEKESNNFIGDFAFWNIINENHSAEIGYIVKPEFWKNGYINETLDRLIKFGFYNLNLQRLETVINPINKNTKEVLLKNGFNKEAYFKENRFYNGKYLDSEIYSLKKQF